MSKQGQVIDTGVEALHCGALQRPAPYYAKVIGEIDNGKGYWGYLRVGVFQRPEADTSAEGYTEPKVSDTDTMVGEYEYNYGSIKRTFHPFQLRGRWYALYSRDYTSTRVMELPSCKDLGGEERDSWGFCPVDYWVPPLHYIETLHDEGCPRDDKRGHAPDYTKSCTCTIVHDHGCPCCPETRVPNESCTCKNAWDRFFEKYHIWHFPDRVHGFVAGCVWGDDTSWKIEHLDLSRADEGIIKRDARFGYIEMPHHLDLDKAIDLDDIDEDSYWLTIAVQRHFDIKTGKCMEDSSEDETEQDAPAAQKPQGGFLKRIWRWLY